MNFWTIKDFEQMGISILDVWEENKNVVLLLGNGMRLKFSSWSTYKSKAK